MSASIQIAILYLYGYQYNYHLSTHSSIIHISIHPPIHLSVIHSFILIYLETHSCTSIVLGHEQGMALAVRLGCVNRIRCVQWRAGTGFRGDPEEDMITLLEIKAAWRKHPPAVVRVNPAEGKLHFLYNTLALRLL